MWCSFDSFKCVICSAKSKLRILWISDMGTIFHFCCDQYVGQNQTKSNSQWNRNKINLGNLRNAYIQLLAFACLRYPKWLSTWCGSNGWFLDKVIFLVHYCISICILFAVFNYIKTLWDKWWIICTRSACSTQTDYLVCMICIIYFQLIIIKRILGVMLLVFSKPGFFLFTQIWLGHWLKCKIEIKQKWFYCLVIIWLVWLT